MTHALYVAFLIGVGGALHSWLYDTAMAHLKTVTRNCAMFANASKGLRVFMGSAALKRQIWQSSAGFVWWITVDAVMLGAAMLFPAPQ